MIRRPLHRFIVRSVSIVARRSMSFEAAVLKLNSPVKDLVLSVTRDGREFLGENEADANDVLGWIDKISQKDFLAENGLKVCTISLLPSQFFLIVISGS